MYGPIREDLGRRRRVGHFSHLKMMRVSPGGAERIEGRKKNASGGAMARLFPYRSSVMTRVINIDDLLLLVRVWG